MLATKEHLSLRAVNMTKTAYAMFNFYDTFFSNYDVSELDTNTEHEEKVSCKVPMKGVIGVFRNFTNKDKKVHLLCFVCVYCCNLKIQLLRL